MPGRVDEPRSRPGLLDLAFQSLQARLELKIFLFQLFYLRLLSNRSLLQRLSGDHQNAVDIRRGDGDIRSDRPYPVVAKGGEEVLSHGSVVAESLRIVTDVVPAGELQPLDFAKNVFSVDGLEVFFKIPVGAGSEADLAFDHRNAGVANTDLVVRIDGRSGADRGGVDQIANRDIRPVPDGGVPKAGCVGAQRTVTDGARTEKSLRNPPRSVISDALPGQWNQRARFEVLKSFFNPIEAALGPAHSSTDAATSKAGVRAIWAWLWLAADFLRYGVATRLLERKTSHCCFCFCRNAVNRGSPRSFCRLGSPSKSG